MGDYSNDTVSLQGFDELEEVFRITGPKVANRVMRNAVTDIAREITKDAKKRVPVRSGTLKKALKAKRRRGQRGELQASVMITQGRDAKHDAFYWRMVEYGTRHSPARPFLRPAQERMESEIKSTFSDKIKKRIVKEIEKLDKRKK